MDGRAGGIRAGVASIGFLVVAAAGGRSADAVSELPSTQPCTAQRWIDVTWGLSRAYWGATRDGGRGLSRHSESGRNYEGANS